MEEAFAQVRVGLEMAERGGRSTDDMWRELVVSIMPGFVALQKQSEGDFDGYKEYMAQLLGLPPQQLRFPCEDLHVRLFKLARCSNGRREEFDRAIGDLAQLSSRKHRTISDILRTVVEFLTKLNHLANILIPPELKVQMLKELERQVEQDPFLRTMYENCNGDYDLLESMLRTPFTFTQEQVK